MFVCLFVCFSTQRVQYFLRALPAIPSSLRSNGSKKSQQAPSGELTLSAIDNRTYDSTDSICNHDYNNVNVYSETVDNSLNDEIAGLPSDSTATPLDDVRLNENGNNSRKSCVQPRIEPAADSPRCLSGLYRRSAVDYQSESSLISEGGTGSVLGDDDFHVYEVVPDDERGISDSSYMDMTASIRRSNLSHQAIDVKVAEGRGRRVSCLSSVSAEADKAANANECVIDMVDAYGYMIPTQK